MHFFNNPNITSSHKLVFGDTPCEDRRFHSILINSKNLFRVENPCFSRHYFSKLKKQSDSSKWITTVFQLINFLALTIEEKGKNVHKKTAVR
jgi:hypothetical protein